LFEVLAEWNQVLNLTSLASRPAANEDEKPTLLEAERPASARKHARRNGG